MRKRSKFIVFEGVDHCGKTTQLDRAEEFLRKEGQSVLRLREPGGTAIGEKIREILLDKENSNLHPKTELMLFFASRIQLLETQVEPALRSGKIVLLDRYYYSSAAYQGVDLFGPNWVLNFAEDWLRLLEPDLVIYLDGDPELLAARAHGMPDRIEAKGISYQKKVRAAYLSMADHRGDLFHTIDATRPIDTVWVDVKRSLSLFVLEGTKN